ncbi:MAG: PLD nuclease N-terminal domain-containing protein [Bacteroidota bacterium]
MVSITVFVFVVPTLYALVDIAKNNFEKNNKLFWLLLVLFTNFFGAILYFTIGRNQRLSV